jgi:hypothetical protein
VTPHELAEALAVRLDDVLPEGLRVRADGDRVVVLRGDQVLGASAAPRIIDGDTSGRQLATATYATINAVQDVVAEELTTPWPARSRGMPQPQARLDGRMLYAWFGPAERPVLALRPLDIG